MDLEQYRERFEAKYDRGTQDECWEWTAYRNVKGYGRIKALPAETYAHRLSYRLAYGDIPDGLLVLHRCDNPPCVNPNHLFLGTNDDNMRDSRLKGRQLGKKGMERHVHPHTKYTDADIADMVMRYVAGESQNSIAESYGTTQGTIGKLVRPRCDVNPRDRMKGGSGRPPALDTSQVSEIRSRWRSGESLAALARAFEISDETACRAAKGIGPYRAHESSAMPLRHGRSPKLRQHLE